MDASTTRQANFLALFKSFREKNDDLPNKGMLKLFAAKLDLSDAFLSHIKCNRKKIGHAVARQIEEKLQLEVGWLDQVHNESDPKTAQERALVDTMLTLLRSSPVEAQAVLMEMLTKRLKQKI